MPVLLAKKMGRILDPLLSDSDTATKAVLFTSLASTAVLQCSTANTSSFNWHLAKYLYLRGLILGIAMCNINGSRHCKEAVCWPGRIAWSKISVLPAWRQQFLH